MKPDNNLHAKRLAVGTVCTVGLLLVFVFQRLDVASLAHPGQSPIARFLINRTIRFLLNDILAIGLIYALFVERKYVMFAVFVQVLGMVLVLMPYFIMKLYFPHYNGPLLSFLHRLILNPTILLLLIPAFYYQKHMSVRG